MNNTKSVHPPNLNNMGGINSLITSCRKHKLFHQSDNSLVSSWIYQPDSPYIMSGSTRLARISIDTTVLNLNLFKSCVGDDLFEVLSVEKEVLQGTSVDQEKVFRYEKGNKYFEWNIKRTGTKMCPYVLVSGDIRLSLSTRHISTGDKPNAQLHIGSLSSQENPLGVLSRVKSWLSFFGILVKEDTVSRIDLCHDFLLSIRDKRVGLAEVDKIVTKATKHAMYYEHRRLTGVQWGKGNIICRCYDKILEVSKPNNEHKLDFFTGKWGQETAKRKTEKPLSDVTRVEFQLRKEALNEFDIGHGSFAEVLNNVHSIWKYLTCDWFRHCKKVVDRKNRNQDKVGSSYFWRTVQAVSKVEEMACRGKRIIVKKSVKAISAQMRGLLITFCAGCGFESDDYQGMINHVREIIGEEFEKCFSLPNWKKEYDKRKNNTILVHDEVDHRDIFEGYSYSDLFAQARLPF